VLLSESAGIAAMLPRGNSGGGFPAADGGGGGGGGGSGGSGGSGGAAGAGGESESMAKILADGIPLPRDFETTVDAERVKVRDVVQRVIAAAAAADVSTSLSCPAVLRCAVRGQMSQTAQDDLEFEKSRKEAQRLAQQARGASALSALAGKKGGGGVASKVPAAVAEKKGTGSDGDDLALSDNDSDDENAAPSVQAAIAVRRRDACRWRVYRVRVR
jgi:hypothetical protein